MTPSELRTNIVRSDNIQIVAPPLLYNLLRRSYIVLLTSLYALPSSKLKEISVEIR